MSPPIRDGSGDSIGSIRLGDGSEISEVRTGAGDVLFSAGSIPDSAIHRWKLDDVSSGTVTDSIGGQNGSVSGVSSVSNSDFQGGAAGDSDGSNDFISTGTLGSFGSNIDTDFTWAFTVDNHTGSSGQSPLGIIDTGTSGEVRCSVKFSRSVAGDIRFVLADTNGDTFAHVTDAGGHVDDGNLHRVLIEKRANSGSAGFDFYIADKGDASYTQISSSVEFDQGFDSVEDFTDDFTLFAERSGSSATSHIDITLDDVIIYNDSLTSSQRNDDLSIQPSFG